MIITNSTFKIFLSSLVLIQTFKIYLLLLSSLIQAFKNLIIIVIITSTFKNLILIIIINSNFLTSNFQAQFIKIQPLNNTSKFRHLEFDSNFLKFSYSL